MSLKDASKGERKEGVYKLSLASIPERCETILALAYRNKPPSRGLRGVDPLSWEAKEPLRPHGGCHCSDLKSLENIARVNHCIWGIVRFGSRCSVTVLSLKGASKGEGRMKYINCHWPRFLSDVRLDWHTRTISNH